MVRYATRPTSKHYPFRPLGVEIFQWYRTNKNDVIRSGRPQDVVRPGNIAKIREFVLSDRKMKLNEIIN